MWQNQENMKPVHRKYVAENFKLIELNLRVSRVNRIDKQFLYYEHFKLFRIKKIVQVTDLCDNGSFHLLEVTVSLERLFCLCNFSH